MLFADRADAIADHFLVLLLALARPFARVKQHQVLSVDDLHAFQIIAQRNLVPVLIELVR